MLVLATFAYNYKYKYISEPRKSRIRQVQGVRQNLSLHF